MDILIWSRVVERALSVLIGGLCIYLGYRLFIRIPRLRDSEGKLNLPGGISIYLTRIGPGVFFALFGAALVALALQRGLEFDAIQAHKASGTSGNLSEQTQSTRVRYAGDGAGDASRLASLRAEARRTMAELAGLEALLLTSLPATRRLDVQQALREARLSVMQSVWAPDWGDWPGFRAWVQEGVSAAPPTGLHADALSTWRQVRP